MQYTETEQKLREELEFAKSCISHPDNIAVIDEARAILALRPKREPMTDAPTWTVFNSGAEVADGLTHTEAMDYLTTDRLARGWCAVCVVDESNAAHHDITTQAKKETP